ncbi:MAG: hypothetical protein A2046_13890 [Bacteroidetes bacterium GWA2_30_7]|nr:MAG: hypothetical protein A2046_13890 [Bacteroidetes bacterium GWA2_30_7]
MKKGNILVIITLTIFIFVLMFNNSCRKPDKPKAIISVQDSAGYAVEGAKIKIFINKNNNYIDPVNKVSEYVDYSDASGQLEYESEFEGIRDVYVEKAADSVAYFKLRKGEGFIRLEKDKVDQAQPIKIR